MANEKENWKAECYGDEVREKLLEFADRGWENIPEDEREEWFSRFKFWGVFHHRGGQESYFMMRLTNCGGVLEPGQLRAIGEVLIAVATGFMVGMACAFSEGAIFAQVPAMFPNSSGAVAGVVGGIGTVGGIVYPLVYSSTLLPNLHVGYAIVAVTMVPIVLLNAWVYRPKMAEIATTHGWFVSASESAEGAPASGD